MKLEPDHCCSFELTFVSTSSFERLGTETRTCQFSHVSDKPKRKDQTNGNITAGKSGGRASRYNGTTRKELESHEKGQICIDLYQAWVELSALDENP